ncbi:hypothetical protein [Vibrio sp. SCSIO 43137]|uniref:hypothetical protein n=1 Tax=Vibrio sp. SCSIO 43137 TaxID=3021011 RepID=UPI002307ABF0|nr:hypothetical protein [Vibrio sp. SCSIO 43137]WCE30768.1 hypothetical protein PK654_05700 [Vibrio sp. SCSIO 43137]
MPPFEEALLEFASVKPVLAYKLRGKEKLYALVSHTNSYRQNCKKAIENQVEEEWFKEILHNSSDNLKENNISELIDSLDQDILLLAEHCGSNDFKECKQVLTEKRIKPDEIDFSDLDKFLDELTTEISNAAQEVHQSQSSS